VTPDRATSATNAARPAIAAVWYDGSSARGRGVQVSVDAGTLWLLDVDGQRHGVALRRVQWPERTRHGQRVVQLPGGAGPGGSLAFADAAAFDAWRAALGHRESWVVRAQQRWRATLAALLALVLVGAAGYTWGIPALARGVVTLTPPQLDAAIGDAALEQLRSHLFKPTQTAPAVQAQWRQRLQDALQQAYPEGATPWQLHFAGGGRLGANAVALPGGHIVVTDEMLALLQGADDAVLGVLAHEHGHLRRRHGLHAVVRFGIVSAATSVALGDFSSLLAGVPALLAHLGYARDAEREADADAAFVLRAAGRDPAAMVQLFERLQAEQAKAGGRPADGPTLPIAFASHPADEERVRFFRDAARR
jgi:Zn-dependent protease with chaperone function